MSKNKLFSVLICFVFILSSCSFSENSFKIADLFHQLFLNPMENFVLFMSVSLDISYGVSLILLVILVKSMLLPLAIFSSAKSMNQSIKLKYLKNDIDDLRKKISNSITMEERQDGYINVKKFNRQYRTKTFDLLGLVPMFIQVPILSSLFLFINNTPEIASTILLGIHFGKKNLVITIFIFLIYLFQSFINMRFMEKSEKVSKWIFFLSPLMMLIVTYAVPASLAFYWLISGIFACIQTILMNCIVKPYLLKKVENTIKSIKIK